MGQDLRIRIAQALQNMDDEIEITFETMADAVIQALGLRIEYGALDHTDSGRLSDANDLTPLRGETIKTRYITDWHPHG